ncbi:DeoR family transcriptional regulator [Paenibacillus larvae]|uniref:DeoR/GlpR family DNA-binding transcription regulator n=1 Tax=Paenibacillus larvae TaxID=1464 RepID=UPI00227E2CD5|nr:DeoR family transcriptional regulator [Paenibacillus larvae]MCY9509867.1 DeoR family transcriptional regulator [Paenibacillus larvae]MCY9523752.1 DeoR family transcriptional regulator [Paenibacillus larvae]
MMFEQERKQKLAEKERIAAQAADLIEEGNTLLLDAGTTTFYLAKKLKKFGHLRVITNSLLVLNELKDSRNIELTLAGGIFRPETQAFIGPMAEECLDMVRVDLAFLGANGLDLEEGLTTPNLLEAAMKRKMIRIAKQVTVLADHSKIGKVSYGKVAGLTDVDSFILDTGVPEEFVSALNQRGIQVTLA